MKQEKESPAKAALVNRIAKYSYASPSPSKNTKTNGRQTSSSVTRGGDIKVEFEEPVESPTRARSTRSITVRSSQGSVASPSAPPGPRGVEEGGKTVSPHFARRQPVPATQQPLDYTVDSDDDLESIEDPSDRDREVGLPRKRRKIGGGGDELESDSDSASGGGSESEFQHSDEDEDEDEDFDEGFEGTSDDGPDVGETSRSGAIRQQTRIRARRAGRADRPLIATPNGALLSASTPTTRVRRTTRPRVQVDDQGDQDQEEREEDPASPPQARSMEPKRKVKAKAKGKKPRAYADPEVYQHLRPLPDILAPDLDLVFCGINPGMKSSKSGHHFAHPTNKFWRALHYSGLTSRLVPPAEDHLLPQEFSYGLTVLVDRPTAEQSELSTYEMKLNVLPFTEKLMRIKPGVVCFVGKKIWDVYENVVHKTARVAEDVPRGQGESTTAVKQEVPDSSAPYTTPSPVPEPDRGSIKTEPLEEIDELEDDTDDQKPILAALATPLRTAPVVPGQRRTPAKEKTKFDWSKPRPFRLPHQDDNGQMNGKSTYFWVVPNTSGLERTPLAEQIVLFGHLNKFKNELGLQGGASPVGVFRDINLEGVRQTVEGIKQAVESKKQGRDMA